MKLLVKDVSPGFVKSNSSHKKNCASWGFVTFAPLCKNGSVFMYSTFENSM